MGTPRVAQQVDEAAQASRGRVELPYLDGIRGLAALAVVVYHAYLFTGQTGEAKAELPGIGLVVGWGYLGVPVFIVLSGYVLMLPLLRDNELKFPGGMRSFMIRRARRILPPYYAALVVSLGLIALVPVLQHDSSTQWDSKVPVSIPDVVTHLLLVHDFAHDSVGKIDGPLWSVAVEWQIYFLMPLLVLLWRRCNGYVVVVAAAAITLFVSVPFHVLTYAHPWFIALFAMGMLSAQVTIGKTFPPWQFTTAAVLILGVLTATWAGSSRFTTGRGWASEMLVGIVVAVSLAYLGKRSIDGKPGMLRSVLQTRPFVFAGTISYSVYLLHSPLLGLANLVLLPAALPISLHWTLMTFVAVPVSVSLCYLLFLLVERNFLNTRQKNARKDLSA